MSSSSHANVLEFPGCPPCAPQVGSPVPPRGPSATHARRHYTLHDLARLLDWQDQCQRTIIRRLRALVDNEGLPAPLGQRLRKGRLCRGSASVCANSRWDAAQVDAWLHRPGPVAPEAHAFPAPKALQSLRAAMADRARKAAGGQA